MWGQWEYEGAEHTAPRDPSAALEEVRHLVGVLFCKDRMWIISVGFTKGDSDLK